jgi:aryl-alcohol dehydrogenase-like predicted oxidoreductase
MNPTTGNSGNGYSTNSEPLAHLPTQAYGRTDLSVSTLGLGTIPLGNPGLDPRAVAELLDLALAAGIRLIDTAPSYGLAEERLGHWLRLHRQNVTLSTKLGYGVPGVEDWTGACITAGVEQALRSLQTDWLDIAHLHSCPREILQRDEVLDALEAAKRAGKIRAMAYSGDGEALQYAVDSGRFDGYMASLNLFDQRIIESLLPRLDGRGFIAKRPLANAPWRFSERPRGDECEPYWLRWQAMGLADPGMPWGELAIRFALGHRGVDCAVIGSAQPGHLRECLAWAAKGPLPAVMTEALHAAFRSHDQGWSGRV